MTQEVQVDDPRQPVSLGYSAKLADAGPEVSVSRTIDAPATAVTNDLTL